MRNKIICKLTLLLYVNWILILPKGDFQSDQALHHRYKKRGMIMYQTLWNSINHQVKKSHASAAFLAVSLIEWTTLGLLAGFFISIIGGMSAITKLTVILCAGGYTGLIFGFFGGILCLYRTDSRHSYKNRTCDVSQIWNKQEHDPGNCSSLLYHNVSGKKKCS